MKWTTLPIPGERYLYEDERRRGVIEITGEKLCLSNDRYPIKSIKRYFGDFVLKDFTIKFGIWTLLKNQNKEQTQ